MLSISSSQYNSSEDLDKELVILLKLINTTKLKYGAEDGTPVIPQELANWVHDHI